MNYLIVAHLHENVEWTRAVLPRHWQALVYDAGSPGNPNSTSGCEAYAYLRMICALYPTWNDDAVVAFTQGNPFPHCPNFVADLDSKDYQGRLHWCNSKGLPHCECLDLDAYCKTIGLAALGEYHFSEGAHFKTTAKKIRSRPLEFYLALQHLCNSWHPADPKFHAFTMERLWLHMLDIKP